MQNRTMGLTNSSAMAFRNIEMARAHPPHPPTAIAHAHPDSHRPAQKNQTGSPASSEPFIPSRGDPEALENRAAGSRLPGRFGRRGDGHRLRPVSTPSPGAGQDGRIPGITLPGIARTEELSRAKPVADAGGLAPGGMGL